jgi:2-polyprenyl-3-methyl-5-hydroxy-6-metoxy-1,4-benzoquinol methylase
MVEAFRQRGCEVRITAIDHDERVIAVARKLAAPVPEISLMHADISEIGRWGEFDFIFSNHLLHHLREDEIAALLEAVVKQCRISFLMNDIDRGLPAYGGYALLCSLLFRRSLALHDGLLSIRRSLTFGEWRRFLALRGLDGSISVRKAAPFRAVLVAAEMARKSP